MNKTSIGVLVVIIAAVAVWAGWYVYGQNTTQDSSPQVQQQNQTAPVGSTMNDTGGTAVELSTTITQEQVSQNNSLDTTCWVIIDGMVYDLTSFADSHPGGRLIISQSCGKDVTTLFNAQPPHSRASTLTTLEGFKVGSLQ